MKTTYQIVVHSAEYVQVNHETLGFCDTFNGPTCRADAIRYIKQAGGKKATFEFVEVAR